MKPRIGCGICAGKSHQRIWAWSITTEEVQKGKGQKAKQPKLRKVRPVHPGDVLREHVLKPLHMSVNKLSLALGVPVTRMNEIVHGRRAVTADTALRLARFLGTTPDFWMNMQAGYDLEVAKEELANEIARAVRPYEASI